jgi:hypothetical protein
VPDEIRPGDPRLHVDQPTFAIEIDDALHAAHVEQPAVRRELLPAHCVTGAAHAHELAARVHLVHDTRRFVESRRNEATANGRRIELRVDVVANVLQFVQSHRRVAWTSDAPEPAGAIRDPQPIAAE